MLKRLEISNYALIENVTIQLEDGFTAITGETGAGKSILLKALHLLLGERADQEVIRQSENKCFLEAEFDITDLDLKDFYEKNDLVFDRQTIIRREFSTTGKSRCFVNDSPVQLSILKTLGQKIISIHSQHDTLELFSADFQTEVIDHFAGIYNESKEYYNEFQSHRTKVKTLIELQIKDKESRKEKDYVEFLLNELNSADLDNLNLEDLKIKNDQIENAEKISSLVGLARSVFENETYGPFNGIKTLLETLEELKKYDPKAVDLHARILSLKIELDDIENEIHGYSGEFEFSPSEAQEIREKMDLLNSLCFKHNLNEVSELKTLREKLSDQLEGIDNLELQIQSLTAELEQEKIELNRKAGFLTEKRKEAAPNLGQKVEQLLQDLAMPNAELKIEILNKTELGPNGKDEINFLFKTNKGGSFLPIRKIASGGEMSRLMLSILSLLSETKNLPTLIFDEIDTGVSGEIASKMANTFSAISQRIQVIAITHLAQVAGKAERHLHVAKTDNAQRTFTSVQELSGENRINELAKMISGEQVTDAARENALHLLNNS